METLKTILIENTDLMVEDAAFTLNSSMQQDSSILFQDHGLVLKSLETKIRSIGLITDFVAAVIGLSGDQGLQNMILDFKLKANIALELRKLEQKFIDSKDHTSYKVLA